MKYTKEFKNLTELNTYIGTGNPNSEILIIGKEVATDTENGKNKSLEAKNLIAFNSNVENWKKNIKINLSQNKIPNWNDNIENNPLYAFKGVEIKKEGHTWRKYQKLYNLLYENQENNTINFQENFFITEMSVLPSKTTKEAQKKSDFQIKLKERKEIFLKSDFIQNFQIVILACGDYINGKELTDIFEVEFIEQKGTKRQHYWIHKNLSEKPKLVIHTRQLSANVSNELLIGIANEIKNFLKK
jgi:hypothetical protein